jgi:hypothetical protein
VNKYLEEESPTDTNFYIRPAFGLLMSLNMSIEFGDAFDFSGADFWSWCKEAGFKSYEVLHLVGPCSAAIAYK